jgi:hypothetical protein
MSHRYICSFAALIALVSLAQGQGPQGSNTGKAKTAQGRAAARTPDGHPDMSGYWANNNATPLQRPAVLAGRERLTDAEVDAMRKKAEELFGGDGDAAFGDDVFSVVLDNVLGKSAGFKSKGGTTGDYSSIWTVDRVWDNRTSLIIDPPDGRMPPPSEEALARRQANPPRVAGRRPAGPEDRGLTERCITYGSPQTNAGYQSYYQIFQTPQTVALLSEMIHDSRMIRMDGSPHLPPSFQEWHGDSRGHWDGDTLVVDSTNYKPGAFRGSTEKLHVTERFTLNGPDTLEYQITLDDPAAWSRPWTLMIPWHRSPKPVFEYACHEGNYSMAGILAGARAEEAEESRNLKK